MLYAKLTQPNSLFVKEKGFFLSQIHMVFPLTYPKGVIPYLLLIEVTCNFGGYT